MVSASGKLAVGDTLTSAALVTNEGKQVNLAELAQTQGVVLFTYPKVRTYYSC
jgi:peroxiredoxin